MGPAALLGVIPKCPLCLAGYFAMVSGLALPFSTASNVRGGLIDSCIVALLYVAIRKLLQQTVV
jgi:hypothetical protein